MLFVGRAVLSPLVSWHREPRPVLTAGNVTPSSFDVHHALVLVDRAKGRVFVALPSERTSRRATFVRSAEPRQNKKLNTGEGVYEGIAAIFWQVCCEDRLRPQPPPPVWNLGAHIHTKKKTEQLTRISSIATAAAPD